jgi:hypothetical protein
MDLPINVKHSQEFLTLRNYIKSVNESHLERKSQTYSYDFKNDTPMKLLDSNRSDENFQEYAKVISGVNYEWEKVNQNLIGRKTIKQAEFPIKKKIQNILQKKKRIPNSLILPNRIEENYTYSSDENNECVLNQSFCGGVQKSK